MVVELCKGHFQGNHVVRCSSLPGPRQEKNYDKFKKSMIISTKCCNIYQIMRNGRSMKNIMKMNTIGRSGKYNMANMRNM